METESMAERPTYEELENKITLLESVSDTGWVSKNI